MTIDNVFIRTSEFNINAHKFPHIKFKDLPKIDYNIVLKIYNDIKAKRKQRMHDRQSNWFGKLSPVVHLSDDNDEVWGSKRQYLYGYICSYIMNSNNITILPLSNTCRPC